MQKTCFKCQQTLGIEQFYKHPQMGDGYLNKCKDCTKKDATLNYATHREQYSRYEQERFQDPARKAKTIEYQRRWRARSPEKYKARQLVGNAVRDGRLRKEPCQFCGNEKSQAHHDDYNKPLDVVWACFKCHREKLHGQTVMTSP